MIRSFLRSSRSVVPLMLLALSPPAGLVAQAAVAPPTRLTAQIRSAVIDTVVARLARIYVEADTGVLIGQGLRKKLAAGAYDQLDNPAQFGEAVTRDLRAINGDLHLSLRFAPGGGENRSGPQGDPTRQNFGLGRVDILDGNVGYLEITGFAGARGYQEVVADALRFLARTDAVIIDVRRNPGGSGEMSHFVFSHFLSATPVPTIRVKRRAPSEPVVRRSLAEVPGPRRPEVPLYVLTSQSTGSAAEEFSFVLKNQRRATIVGSRTAGAGHMVNIVRAGHGFLLGLSITRVSDPETGKEWEGVGVQPDIAVPAERALVEAHVAALRTILSANTDADWGRRLERFLATADARRNPQPIDPARLARLAGNYDGRVVSISNGRLFLARRAGGLGEEL
ncbi:MAG TPA: S41 family peptidase, partial [Gemmatimonadales bacterium]